MKSTPRNLMAGIRWSLSCGATAHVKEVRGTKEVNKAGGRRQTWAMVCFSGRRA
jgi:hypothetical protein